MKNIPIILLIGGKGTRLASPTQNATGYPKSLQKINSKYLLFHAMQNYMDHGFNNFIFPLGNYKKVYLDFFYSIKKINNKPCKILKTKKDFFNNLNKNKTNSVNLYLLNTKTNANKAERVYACVKSLDLSNFGVSYGDGVGDINIRKLYKQHNNSNCIMSVAAKKPFSQYGIFKFNNNIPINFIEKPVINHWANIGYFFIKKEGIKYINKYKKNDLEMGIMKKIAMLNLLDVFKHNGFWKSVDTQKDALELTMLLKKNAKQ